MLSATSENKSEGKGVLQCGTWHIREIGLIRILMGRSGLESGRQHARDRSSALLLALAFFVVAGCVAQPGVPYILDTSPLPFVDNAGVRTDDQRSRFREIVCAVNERSGRRFPGYRPCSEILNGFFDEPLGAGAPVHLGPARSKLRIAVVGGLGAECFADLVQTLPFALGHLRSLGFSRSYIRVDGLSSSTRNGRQIRDAVLTMDLDTAERLILVGYSKGAPDIIEGLITYPEVKQRVAAVITIAGAVKGSPLTDDAPEWMLTLLGHLPGTDCDEGDGRAIESLKPSIRREFAATQTLPSGIRYYSLGTFAPRESISTPLQWNCDELSKIDPRNDGQMIFYDQIVPGGTLLGFVKSDHWAVALPISRQYPHLAPYVVDRNDFPREIVLEAAVRHVEEQLLAKPDAETENLISLRRDD